VRQEFSAAAAAVVAPTFVAVILSRRIRRIVATALVVDVLVPAQGHRGLDPLTAFADWSPQD
jgi:hypothetical protein